MRLLFASMYVTSPQGRIGGINSLCYGGVKDILRDGHSLTTDFKTFAAFTFQPVVFIRFGTLCL